MKLQYSIETIKAVHSIIWLLMVLAICYILYSGITGKISIETYLCIGLIAVETAVLSLNHWSCPLTNLAQNVKPNWQDGDDIYLPKWVAIHNKLLFGTLFLIGIFLIIVRLFIKK